jgi:hypothetical protein
MVAPAPSERYVRRSVVPATVWAYVVVSFLPLLYVALSEEAYFPAGWELAFSIFIAVGLAYGMIRGARVAWWAALAWNLFGVIGLVFFTVLDLTQVVMGLLIIGEVGLVLAPATRQYVFGRADREGAG